MRISRYIHNTKAAKETFAKEEDQNNKNETNPKN